MLDRTTAPPFVKNTSFSLISPQREKFSNGIELFLIDGGNQEVIKVEFVFRAGRWFEGALGVSHFTAQLLSKGTTSRSSFEIAELFDRLGAHLEVHPGLDFVSVSLYSLTKNIKEALKILFDILFNPSFPEKEIEQAKTIYLQNLRISLEKTSYLASRHFRKNLFGVEHPYGAEPDESDIKKLSRDALVDFFQKHYSSPSVFVSGKIDSNVTSVLIRMLAGWKNASIGERKLETPMFAPSRELITKEGSVQSSIRLGSYSLERTHPDYAATVFVSHILGGYFGSRLMKNIREEKGLTYGIHASVHPLRRASYLAVGADVNRENVEQAFSEIRKEFSRLGKEPIDADELNTARNHFIGSLQSELTTPFSHADKIKTKVLFHLPDNYYHEMIRVVDSLDSKKVMEIGRVHFNNDRLFEIAVG